MSFTGIEKTNFTFYPLLCLAAAFAAGILASSQFWLKWHFYLVVCIFAAFVSFAIINRSGAKFFVFISFIAAGGLHFQINTQNVAADRLKTIYDTAQIRSGDPVEIEGVLTKDPELAVGGMFLFVETEKMTYNGKTRRISGNVKLFAPIRDERIADEYKSLDLRFGVRLRVAAGLRRQDDFLNPGVASRRQILDGQGIDATATIKSPLLIEIVDDKEASGPIASLYSLRQALIIEISETFNGQTAGILIASLLGNRHFLSKQTAEVFREGGTFHVLVISGLHITFIGGLALLFIGVFTKNRLWQFILASAFLWSYSVAVGAEVPVVRASLMFTILLLSRIIHRRGTLLNAFGASILILLVWRPDDVFDPSFQLTVTSVAAIIVMAFPLIENLRAIGKWSPTAQKPFPPRVPNRVKRFCELLYWREEIWEKDVARQIWSARLFKSPYLRLSADGGVQRILAYLFEGILVSLIVEIWLMPFIIVYFHRLPLFSILLNLWVGMSVAIGGLTAGFALLLAQLSDAAAVPFVRFTEFLYWFLIWLPQFLIDSDLASVRLPVYTGNMRALYALYFLPLLVLTALLENWKPFHYYVRSQISNVKFMIGGTFSILILFLAAIVFHPLSGPGLDGRLTIDFLDVGQGDAALMTFPNGETLLVDGGGKMTFNKTSSEGLDNEEAEIFEPDTPSIGEAVVSEFLWEKGISRIDHILATHADADHIQGLVDVARNFQIGGAFFGRVPADDTDFAALHSMLVRRGIDYQIIGRGDVLNFGDVRLEVLYPVRDESPEAVSDNNHSVVLRIIYGNRKFLLTGDIEKETEELLIQNSVLQADVVKVAHHGSRTSSISGFIDAAKAEYAIIPVGRESSFGHPHDEVLERWQNSGATILTTSGRGTISISTDGKDLRVETFLK